MNSLRAACFFTAVATAVIAGAALAQTSAAPPPMPANVAPPPLPAVPDPASPPKAAPAAGSQPSPEEYKGGKDDEQQVTTIRRDEETVEEVRVGGNLQYVRVTPRRGRPYYLVPSGNGQTFNRMDSLGSGLSVPMWMLFSW